MSRPRPARTSRAHRAGRGGRPGRRRTGVVLMGRDRGPGVPRPQLRARSAGARGADARLRRRHPRRLGRQRRAADDGPRPRRLPRPAPVGRQRLPAGPGLPRPRRRGARRPARPATGLPRRRRRLRRRLGPVRAGPDAGSARGAARPAGRRCGAAHARCPRPHPGLVPPRGPRRRHRYVGRAVRHRGRARTGRRGVGRRPRELAVDLRHQRPAVRRRGPAHEEGRPGEPGPFCHRQVRRPRRRLHRPLPRRGHLRPHGVGRVRRVGGDPRLGGRRRERGGLRRRRAALSPPDGPPRDVPQPGLLRGQRDDPARLRRPRRGVPVRHPPAPGRRVECARGRAVGPADHHRPHAPVEPGRGARPAHRPADADDRRAPRLRRRRPAAPRGHRLALVAHRPARHGRLLARAGPARLAADGRGPRRGARPEGGRRERGQQRGARARARSWRSRPSRRSSGWRATTTSVARAMAAGYRGAMVWCAVLLALGGVVSWFGLGRAPR